MGLFVERVAVLFHIILRLQRLDENQSVEEQRESMGYDDRFQSECYDLGVAAIPSVRAISAEMECIIAKSVNSFYESESGGTDGTDMMYKQGIWCIMKLIYGTFVLVVDCPLDECVNNS